MMPPFSIANILLDAMQNVPKTHYREIQIRSFQPSMQMISFNILILEAIVI